MEGRGLHIDTYRFSSHLAARLARLTPPPQMSNAALVARCCLGSVYESVQHWLALPPDQRPTPQALAATVADFILRGTAAPQPRLLSEKGNTTVNSPRVS